MEDVTEVWCLIKFRSLDVFSELRQGLEFVCDFWLYWPCLFIVLLRLKEVVHHLSSVDEALHLGQL